MIKRIVFMLMTLVLVIGAASVTAGAYDGCWVHGSGAATLIPAKDASCTEEGQKAYYVCDMCADPYWDKECTQPINDMSEVAIPGSEHDWGEGKVIMQPSCTMAGEVYYVCQNDKSHTKTEYPAALGHDWETVPEKAPTCTEDGNYEYAICKRCTFGIVDTIPATGHAWDEGKVIMQPSCTMAGEVYYVCQNDKSHTKTEYPAALGHDWETVPEKAPTCTEDGNYEYAICKRCTFGIVDTIPATGHAWDEGKVIMQPSCTMAGEVYYVCQNDKSHTKTEYPAALGHDWETVPEKAPTCTEDGNYEYAICKRCTFGIVDTIPAAGHKPGEYCHNNDKHWQLCSTCGETLSKEKHSLTEKVIKQPTLTCKGVKHLECKTCGYEFNEDIPKLTVSCTTLIKKMIQCIFMLSIF